MSAKDVLNALKRNGRPENHESVMTRTIEFTEDELVTVKRALELLQSVEGKENIVKIELKQEDHSNDDGNLPWTY